ncbi:ATP-binding protein [Alkalihalobacillus sp. R86527]|uniref:ATP-binding protein n=1 Tax=Alkalihalobacillus sp. R86527 TaxID=3093863 RepID=UPI00367210BB
MSTLNINRIYLAGCVSDYMKTITSSNVSLQTKLSLMILVLLFGVLLILGIIFTDLYSSNLEEQMGERALNVSQSVAMMPAVVEAMESDNPTAAIQPIVEEIRVRTGAEFIVVGDQDGIRVAHPIADRIGQHMVGGDSQRALHDGDSYVSKAEGSLGSSLRGKTPIVANGEILGIVSVGFLIEDIEKKINRFELKVASVVAGILIIGLVGGFLIARNVKKSIFGLEPGEISAMYLQRNAILETIREGIISVDSSGKITLANQEAYKLLDRDNKNDLVGEDIISALPSTRMMEVLASGKSHHDHEIRIGKNAVIVNRIPIIQHEEITGVVSSFRRKTEIEELSRQLSQVQSYAKVLRSQTHEYSNKLYTILGLIQLGSSDEAIELIHRETVGYQEVVELLINTVPNATISALLLGKYNRAHELRVDFTIDDESSMSDLPHHIEAEKIVTVLGNLIDNAMEAVIADSNKKRKVHLFLTDLGNDLIFEIEDSGPGIKEEWLDQMFERGFSSKNGEDRGIGLYLVKNTLDNIGGTITISKSRYNGAAFTVFIPKGEQKHG